MKTQNSVSHFLPLIPKWVVGKLVPISRSLWARGGVHPGQVAIPSQGNTQTTMHTLIHTPKGNLERPINLTGMSLDCGRKPEYPCMHARGEHANSVQKDPWTGIEPRTFLRQSNSATNCATVQPNSKFSLSEY
ncbi:hypothetical protein AMECASPLE_025176 [Ameca splendens]|uniref:Uncharacterized protein n=1 Tax=Ameca splendens TaxID=208324 RepID=A0ABV0YRI2_9TELE